ASRHGFDVVERRFTEIVERVMARPSRARLRRDEDTAAAIERRLQTLARPGDVVLVAGGEIGPLAPFDCWPFPQDRDGNAGYEPASGDAAINHLEAQRLRGARYFVLPRRAFGWRHRYPEFVEHLDTQYT